MLAASQIALVLLIGAGLLMRSFERLRSVALGFDAASVVTFDVNLPSGRYGDPERRARFHREFQSGSKRCPACARPAPCRACRRPVCITPLAAVRADN